MAHNWMTSEEFNTSLAMPMKKTNGGLGNDTALLASDLGNLEVDQSLSIGSDANVPTQEISADATDFVSLANINDIDFYSFRIDDPGLLTAILIPRGGTFTQSGEGGTPAVFDASARVDLELTIFDLNGSTVLQTADLVWPGWNRKASLHFLCLKNGE